MNDLKFEDYLSEDEIKTIMQEALRDKINSYLGKDFERMLNNAAYYTMWKEVDSVIDGTFKSQLEKNVQKQMVSFTEFNLFQKPDAWSRETNSAYKLLMQSIENNKHLLDERVKEVVNNLQPCEDWQLDLDVRIGDLIMERLFNKGE